MPTPTPTTPQPVTPLHLTMGFQTQELLGVWAPRLREPEGSAALGTGFVRLVYPDYEKLIPLAKLALEDGVTWRTGDVEVSFLDAGKKPIPWKRGRAPVNPLS